MPYVEADAEGGARWVSRSGADFGLVNGMGIRRSRIRAGAIHRSHLMAAEGLYEDGKKGIRRLTDPELRVKDQDRDGIQAEVLYGILGAAQRLQDPEAGNCCCGEEKQGCWRNSIHTLKWLRKPKQV